MWGWNIQQKLNSTLVNLGFWYLFSWFYVIVLSLSDTVLIHFKEWYTTEIIPIIVFLLFHFHFVSYMSTCNVFSGPFFLHWSPTINVLLFEKDITILEKKYNVRTHTISLISDYYKRNINASVFYYRSISLGILEFKKSTLNFFVLFIFLLVW